MFESLILRIISILKRITTVLYRFWQVTINSNRSRLIKKGAERNLYKTRYGDFFWLTSSGYVDRCISTEGIFEEHSTQLIKKLVRKGDIVLDVGANIGYYSVIFSKLVGNNGKVLCFEPTNHYRKVLEKNLAANNIHNAEVFAFGLSNKSEELEIHIGECSATLHPPDMQGCRNSETINLKSLDDFLQEYKLAKINFIKIDIDGHEPLLLEGAWKTLEKYDPVVLLEVNHLNYYMAGFTVWDLYDLLKNKGYKIYHEEKLIEFRTKTEFLIKCGTSHTAQI